MKELAALEPTAPVVDCTNDGVRFVAVMASVPTLLAASNALPESVRLEPSKLFVTVKSAAGAIVVPS